MHSLLSLALIVAVVFLTSCLEIEEDPLPFGNEESLQDIGTTLNDAFGQVSVEDIKLGEFVHIETTQQPFNSSKFVSKDTGKTISRRVENEDSIELTLVVEEFEYDIDGNEINHAIFESDHTIAKTSASSLSSNSLEKLKMAKVSSNHKKVRTLSNDVGVCALFDHPQISYHKLKVEHSLKEVPKAALDSRFCEGKNPCTVSVTDVSFDQVVWENEEHTGEADKYHCQFSLSEEVPFLANPLKECFTVLLEGESNPVIITQCNEVVNFEPGL